MRGGRSTCTCPVFSWTFDLLNGSNLDSFQQKEKDLALKDYSSNITLYSGFFKKIAFQDLILAISYFRT